MKRYFSSIDWILFCATLPILGAGLLTMNSFLGKNAFFEHQLIWISIALVIFFIASGLDFRFLRRTSVLVALFSFVAFLLVALFFVGHISRGAASWFRLGFFSIQPSDLARLVLVLILAKYFSRRHIEIANVRHIIVSGVYAFIFFILILIQPDLGYAITIFLIWFGMVLASGIKKRHILIMCGIIVITFALLWGFILKPYQKDRIDTFIHPLEAVQGAGYNAYQSTIAVGSGRILGKGIGYGTQSELNFLPEYQTDFIFAAFAEEWGFVGVLILLVLYGIIIWRIIVTAVRGRSNFEILYGFGIALLFVVNLTINIGMNIGLLPITGVTIPFMSYGGSHLVIEFLSLGILMGMRRYAREAHPENLANELIGI